jgi:hypothetical protein
MEMEGIDPPTLNKDLGQDGSMRVWPQLTQGAYLLIPESSNDRVMAFDPVTGNLVNPDFIPADPDNLSTPICAIMSADGQSILVSDQVDDVVQQYDLMGNYIGIFAPAGGENNDILDNIRGIALLPNGNLLVTVGSGANSDAVAMFDTAGNFIGNFVDPGVGGLDSPFDVYVRENDVLVAGISSDAIHRYDLTGAYLGDLTPVNTFPEQLNEAANLNVICGNFSGSEEGIVEWLPDGTLVGVYDPPEIGGNRGAYELPNGNFLTTNGSGVHEVSRDGVLVETKFSGVSARFIELIVIGGGEELVVPLDIKPESCPNPFNMKAQGFLPVALVGTPDFDVTMVDLSTLALTRADGVGGSVMPWQGPPGPNFAYEDVATPYDGDPCGCTTDGPDGIMDLGMKFLRPMVTEALELGDLEGGTEVQLVLSGALTDGTAFTSSDCIVIVPTSTTE